MLVVYLKNEWRPLVERWKLEVAITDEGPQLILPVPSPKDKLRFPGKYVKRVRIFEEIEDPKNFVSEIAFIHEEARGSAKKIIRDEMSVQIISIDSRSLPDAIELYQQIISSEKEKEKTLEQMGLWAQ